VICKELHRPRCDAEVGKTARVQPDTQKCPRRSGPETPRGSRLERIRRPHTQGWDPLAKAP